MTTTTHQITALREAISLHTGCALDDEALLDIAEKFERAAWRPIAEAPAGQIVLVGYRNRSSKERTIRAEFISKFSREHTEDCALDPDYSEDDDAFYWPEGWYERIESWDDFTHVVMYCTPLHFRPLPKGPTDE